MTRPGRLRSVLWPARLLAFALSSASIGSLLVYFLGWMGMAGAVLVLLLPATAALAVLAAWAARRDPELSRRLAVGLWAGGFATAVYDLARVPVAHAGVPVFKAISYFGTVILGVERPGLASEVVGWSYHFSNGVGFAMMYAVLVRRPGILGAVAWGVLLEAAMLSTPYAEVFGYRVSPAFLAVTISAHVCYGLGLWASARLLPGRAGGRRSLLAAAWLAGPLAVALIAADFHRLHAATIPASPPPYIGPRLYVTWNVPEPDRIGAVWLMKRFVDPGASFHLVEPMSRVAYGTPFDLPEAEIRRHPNRSTFEVLLERTGRAGEPAMQALARMCYVTEIRPWALASAEAERRLAEALAARLGDCRDLRACLDAGLAWFDEVYARLSAAPPGPWPPSHSPEKKY